MYSIIERAKKKFSSISQLRGRALNRPVKGELFEVRLLIICGLVTMTYFLYWFFQPENKGTSWLYWMLTSALLFKLLRWLHEWYHYFNVSVPEPPLKSIDEKLKVDMFTTYCAGEPYDMIVNMLKRMSMVEYPHTSYLCDEADDPFLKEKCREFGVIHVTRKEKKDAKAGNINNALKQATGDICVILDPDHIPSPHFLTLVLPYFADEKIGYVQVVQAYYNQAESAIARGAAEQTYQFYGPLMMGMNTYGTVQAIGANCTFRRAALDSIGGHAAGLSEDMHTAMRIHAAGWKSIYIPEIVSHGLVPSTLSAYYKQQLKWSRGTFDLLVNVFPKLFRKFTWRQRVHYFTLPFHYLNGLVTLFDILIPILALLLAKPVWKISIPEFMILFLPVLFMALLIRMYSQRWLAHDSEKGLHLTGGILRMGTWWIYLTGLVCTIFKKDIPYIPTPKSHEATIDLRNNIPNIIAANVCLAAIPLGLMYDWSPYSMFMAGFAFVNAVCLLYVVWISQTQWVEKMNARISKKLTLSKIIDRLAAFLHNTYLRSSVFIRRRAILVSLFFFMIASGSTYRIYFHNPEYNSEMSLIAEKKTDIPFYTGIYMPQIEEANSLNYVEEVEKSLNNKFEIVSIYQSWGPESIEKFPLELLNGIRKNGSVPMITWEPYSRHFPEFSKDNNLSRDWRIFDAILKGKFDRYIQDYATMIRNFGEPVMIRFAHEMDNPSYPWSFYGGGNTPQEFIHAHQYVVKFFNKIGATNVAWVWNPWEEDDLEKYYPGDDFVDWIGITNLNYGLANSNGNWVGFEDLYKPFHDKIFGYNKPVMLSEFGSTVFGGNRAQWYKDALQKIKNNYSEIKSIVFFYHDEDKNWGATKWRPSENPNSINWTFLSDNNTVNTIRTAFNDKPFNNQPDFAADKLFSDYSKTKYSSPFIKDSYPNFQLMVDNKPFFIKGVAYNVGEDWRDGNIPLTRNRLEEDFSLIKEMGANTLRKYSTDVYDYNFLNVANEKGLKVLFGFWFEQNIDYSTDRQKLLKYEEEVLQAVKKYKDHPAVLGWSLGNEVWGLLKHHYHQPYLTIVRNHYARFIEELAVKIHAIDSLHPVFAVGENSKHLPGEFYSFGKLAPSVDVFGVNSYYEEQIGILPNIQYLTDTTRPYLLSEYGPEGYWDSYFSKHDEYNRVQEDAGSIKASLYAKRWDDHIEGKKGMNVGGIAYTWRDRMEGTLTWFGLTDYKGRIKPTYFALKEKWNGQTGISPVKDVYIYSPKTKIKPGSISTFYAITEEIDSRMLNYEWLLCSEEYIKYKIAMEVQEDGKRVSFKIPDDKKGLRLFLFVSDKNEKVVNTASFSILD